MVPLAPAVLFQLSLYSLKDRLLDDRFMFPLMEQLFVFDHAGLKGIGQKCVNRTLVKWSPAALNSALRVPSLVFPFSLSNLLYNRQQGPKLEVKREDSFYLFSLLGVDHQLGTGTRTIHIVPED